MKTNLEKFLDSLRNPGSFSRGDEYCTPISDYRIVGFVTNKGENRFRIEDGKGIVLDDCRSWGYKSIEKAQNAFDYRCRNNPSYQNLRRENSSSRTPELLARKIRGLYEAFALEDVTTLSPERLKD
jgi:hypothetical protein